ncbi:LysR family transcriptional regulator [Pseudomonas spelaei]|uniref:LysR family transcriptional regulator n=1 Tax=Pseudomonas spelaei TaxID=1055469 RepID=UPI001FEA79F8|nr:LysR family transcriptional regulator [Pseudomonas spelaei]
MRNFKRLDYFVAVVETGSFTGAAERMGITKAVVSQQVSLLEHELRTSLLVRTTRKVQTTAAGQTFYQRCVVILSDIEEAFEDVSGGASGLSGSLRITAPVNYGTDIVVPTIAAFSKQHPECKVDMYLSDRVLDIMSSNIELSIRVGWLIDSSQQARKVGSFRQLLVASSVMSPQLAHVNNPQDISHLPFVANTALRNPLRWSFSLEDGSKQAVNVRASIFLNSTPAVNAAVRCGLGLSVLPDFVVAKDLASGRLMNVLPQWGLPSGGIYAVFPASRFRPAKVRAFVDLLTKCEQQRSEYGKLEF